MVGLLGQHLTSGPSHGSRKGRRGANTVSSVSGEGRLFSEVLVTGKAPFHADVKYLENCRSRRPWSSSNNVSFPIVGTCLSCTSL